MKRRPERWRTRFGSFVSRMTVPRIVSELSQRGLQVTNKGVYDWLSGDTVPRAERAMALVKLSRGRLKLQDVFSHRQEVRGDGNGRGSERGAGFSGEGAVATRTTVGARRD